MTPAAAYERAYRTQKVLALLTTLERIRSAYGDDAEFLEAIELADQEQWDRIAAASRHADGRAVHPPSAETIRLTLWHLRRRYEPMEVAL